MPKLQWLNINYLDIFKQNSRLSQIPSITLVNLNLLASRFHYPCWLRKDAWLSSRLLQIGENHGHSGVPPFLTMGFFRMNFTLVGGNWLPWIWHFPRNLGNHHHPLIDEVHHFSGRGGCDPTTNQLLDSPGIDRGIKNVSFRECFWWLNSISNEQKSPAIWCGASMFGADGPLHLGPQNIFFGRSR